MIAKDTDAGAHAVQIDLLRRLGGSGKVALFAVNATGEPPVICRTSGSLVPRGSGQNIAGARLAQDLGASNHRNQSPGDLHSAFSMRSRASRISRRTGSWTFSWEAAPSGAVSISDS